MDANKINKLVENWVPVADLLTKPKNDAQLDKLIEFSDNLMDQIGEDDDHPLWSMLDTIASLIAEYEAEHIPAPANDPIENLKSIMLDFGLKQSDLVEIGSSGVISEVMNGKRRLNARQIKALSERFNCSANLFL